VPFECNRCGKCCISSGAVIRILKPAGRNSFECRCLAGGERFVAVVEPGDLSLYREPPVQGACPFMRRPGKDAVCTVYRTRPAYCRDFRCYRFRILDRDGREAGRVKGRRALETADECLRGLWDRRIASLTITDDLLWEEKAREILAEEGYPVG
jgi:Fe-S-cluster containining protein